MKGILKKATSLFTLTLMGLQLSAQGGTSAGSDLFIYILVGGATLLFAAMLFNVPGLRRISSKKTPAFAAGKPVTNLLEGYDMQLQGEAEKSLEAITVKRYAVQPPNFKGLQPIPKMTVVVGDKVKAGDQLFFDKQMPDIQFVAPVSGEVIEINRGAKRAITEVVILADDNQQYRAYDAPNPGSSSREELVRFMKESGAWALLRQRPYNIIPNPAETPRDIFISTFNSAPLAACTNLTIDGQERSFQQGIDVLAQLTTGKVYLGLDGRGDKAPSVAFTQAKNAEIQYFTGKHPVGNVGVQMHHTAPVGNGMVWTLGVQEVITLGKLFNDGRFDTSRVVALTGAELKKPVHVRTYAGANISELLKGNLANDHVRFISGDVLSGEKKNKTAYLNWYDNQLTVVEEGDYHEMLGWIVPGKARPTLSGSFLSTMIGTNGTKKFKADTNTHGGERAFVTPTDYEQVMPMDIYVQHLMKAIIVNDFERMEGLGLKELVEEDVALCEFACVSKQPLQSILRQGLEIMREQS